MSFVSASALEAQREKRKEEKRQSRQKILHEAKEKFLEEKKRQELKRERGDHVWVAPGVSKRLNLTTKQKKQKKDKNKKKKRDEPDVQSKESGEEEWIEKEGEDMEMETEPVQATPTQATPLERDEWMTLALGPSLSSQVRLEELRKRTGGEEEKKKESLIDQTGTHPLELNPYWREGGSGLPEQSDRKHDKKSTQIGDGGRSWLLRSYKRALERAEQEGRSIEDIAAVQWGSIEKLHEMLKDAGIDPNNPDGHYKGRKELYSRMERRREVPYNKYERDSSRYSMREDKRERKSDRFIKPSFEDGKSIVSLTNDESSGSWRKKTIRPPTSPSPPPPPSLPPTVPSASDKTSSLLPSPPSPPPSPSRPLVTSTQLNSLAAKIMKAEMFGDVSKVERLKNDLKQLQELKSKQDLVQPKDKDRVTHHGHQAQRGGGEREEKGEKLVLLTKTDRHGNVRPLSRPSRSGYEGPVSTHTGKGKRTKYFRDDDSHSLKSLLEAERLSSSDDTQAAILKMASKFVPSSSDRGDETVDDVLDTASLHGKRKKQLKEEEREMQRAINENKRMMDKLDSCKLCFDSSQFEKQLLIAVGINVYLSLPSVQSLTDGHCLLVPMEHTQSSLLTDENVWSEFNLFRKGLTRMFADKDMDVVFMETYTSSKSHSHMYMECIPLSKDIGELAPMYYKKALQESDQEWSDNKKVIDTSKKGVRGSLPVGLPYFYVEFGTDGGYGHIIEDNSKFPHYFGKEVAGGMLDVEPRLWLKPHRESFERQKEKVLRFCDWWSPYDWTQKLKEDRSNNTD